MCFKRLSNLSLGLFALLVACGDNSTADMVLKNGRIVTLDSSVPETQALAIRDGRIIALATDDAELDALIGDDTEVIDLEGRLAIPGFIEGHAHFTSLGESLQILDLKNIESWEDAVAMVREAVAQAEPGEWILGRGWHQEKFEISGATVEGFPTHQRISEVSPDNPVCLTHASGHACFFNQKAMDLASITPETANPAGGEIIKDAGGQPIGVFRERAQDLVKDVHMAELAQRSPEQVELDLRRTLKLADEECMQNGVTSFQDAGSPFSTIDTMKAMAESGELSTRLWVMIRESNSQLAEKLDAYRMIGEADNRLTVRAIKRAMDGALGSRGAWLLEPYADSPESTGLNTDTVEDVTETARLAAEHGYQLCVHAIGDRANRETLDIFERTFSSNPALTDLRWRIEHAQHISAEDIPRFGQLGVVASMQGVHCTSDAVYVLARLGEERAEAGAYVWQKLMQSGALVSNGTDAPVEDVSPIENFYATVSRRLADGSLFFADQKMSRIEALESYTINAARAAFEEDIKGTLSIGKLADVVVLSKDILEIPENEILDAQIVYTIVGGEVRYRNDAFVNGN